MTLDCEDIYNNLVASSMTYTVTGCPSGLRSGSTHAYQLKSFLASIKGRPNCSCAIMPEERLGIDRLLVVKLYECLHEMGDR